MFKVDILLPQVFIFTQAIIFVLTKMLDSIKRYIFSHAVRKYISKHLSSLLYLKIIYFLLRICSLTYQKDTNNTYEQSDYLALCRPKPKITILKLIFCQYSLAKSSLVLDVNNKKKEKNTKQPVKSQFLVHFIQHLFQNPASNSLKLF